MTGAVKGAPCARSRAVAGEALDEVVEVDPPVGRLGIEVVVVEHVGVVAVGVGAGVDGEPGASGLDRVLGADRDDLVGASCSSTIASTSAASTSRGGDGVRPYGAKVRNTKHDGRVEAAPVRPSRRRAPR